MFDTFRYSGELLDDVDFESIATTPLHKVGGWQQQNVYLELIQPSTSSSGYALRARRRKSGISYLSQYIDRSCLGPSTQMEFQASVRFEDSISGIEVLCDNDFLKAKMEFLRDDDLKISFVVGTLSSTDFSGGWYTKGGNLAFDDCEFYLTDQVIFKIEHPHAGIDVILDNINFELTTVQLIMDDPLEGIPESMLTNLALNKPNMISSNFGDDWISSLAVDGDLNTLTHTAQRVGSWWRVDLQAIASIREIKMYTQRDIGQERLGNAIVSIFDSNMI